MKSNVTTSFGTGFRLVNPQKDGQQKIADLTKSKTNFVFTCVIVFCVSAANESEKFVKGFYVKDTNGLDCIS